MGESSIIESRLEDFERILNLYRTECEANNSKISLRLDRVLVSLFGDSEMNIVGFFDTQKMSHESIMRAIGEIESASTESRAHRALQHSLPEKMASLEQTVFAQNLRLAAIEQDKRDQSIRIDTAKTMINWIWVAVGSVPVAVGIIVKCWPS